MVSPDMLPNRLEDLQDLERRIEREWWWINGALHAVAQLQADGPKVCASCAPRRAMSTGCAWPSRSAWRS